MANRIIAQDGCKIFETFEFQGKEYPLNTIVKIKNGTCAYNTKPIDKYHRAQVVEHFIDKRGREIWTYIFWTGIPGNKALFCYHPSISPDEIVERIVGRPPPVNENQVEYYRDSEVSVVMLGWVFYILFMIGIMIFKDFIVGWVFGTVFFYFWRKHKLEKPKKYMFGFDIYEQLR